MQKVIVSDSSCLILFYKIQELELLREVFGEILITEIVSKEFKHPLPGWIKITNPTTNIHKGLLSFLDAGEATSIALAAEHKGSLLIIDELKGRKIARELGIEISGSLGVLVTAKTTVLSLLLNQLLKELERLIFDCLMI